MITALDVKIEKTAAIFASHYLREADTTKPENLGPAQDRFRECLEFLAQGRIDDAWERHCRDDSDPLYQACLRAIKAHGDTTTFEHVEAELAVQI